MDWITHNLTEVVLGVGIALLVIEIVVLGFATFFLLFIGLSAVTTSVLLGIRVLPESFTSVSLSVAVFGALYSVLLYKPLLRLQGNNKPKPVNNDLVGHSFILPDDLKAGTKGVNFDFSGVAWQLQSEKPLAKGTVVEISQCDVGLLYVKAKK